MSAHTHARPCPECGKKTTRIGGLCSLDCERKSRGEPKQPADSFDLSAARFSAELGKYSEEVRKVERERVLKSVADYARRFPQFVPVEAIVGYCEALKDTTLNLGGGIT